MEEYEATLFYDYGDYRTSWSGWNPVADDIYNKYPWSHDDVSSRSYLEITFMPGLKWRTNLSVDFYQYNYGIILFYLISYHSWRE